MECVMVMSPLPILGKISHTKSLNSNAAKIHLLMSQIAQIVYVGCRLVAGGWMPIVNIRQQLG